MELLSRHYICKGSLELGPIAGTVGPGFSQLDEGSPLVSARAGTGEESIDAICPTIASLIEIGHCYLAILASRQSRARKPYGDIVVIT